MKNILIFTLLCLVHFTAWNQTDRVTSEQTHAWIMSNGAIKIKGPFSAFYDVQWRRADLGQNPQQLLLRGALLYQASNSTSFGLGYAFVETSPYGEFPVKNEFLEHRIFEQMQIKQTFAKSNLTHRYRLEQRNIGSSAEGGFKSPRYENRARYMVRYQYLFHKTDSTSFYLNVFDEVFLNFGKEVGRNTFDQNRLGAALGYGINKHVAFELGYLNQYVEQRGLDGLGRNKFENNHTLTFSIVTNF